MVSFIYRYASRVDHKYLESALILSVRSINEERPRIASCYLSSSLTDSYAFKPDTFFMIGCLEQSGRPSQDVKGVTRDVGLRIGFQRLVR